MEYISLHLVSIQTYISEKQLKVFHKNKTPIELFGEICRTKSDYELKDKYTLIVYSLRKYPT